MRMDTEVKVAPFSGGVVAEQNTAMTLDEQLAEAHREMAEKGAALRWATTEAIQGRGSAEVAYWAWKQAKAKTTAIYAELKAHRERLAVQNTA